MKIIVLLIFVAIIIALISIAWPLFVLLAILLVAWKLYESIYYKSSSFTTIKERITSYTKDCNELNNHIEDLKNTNLISNKVDYGNASYQDSSKWNYKRKFLKDQKYAPNIHQCSRAVCNNAKQKPFEYICKYFGLKATEETLSNFETILNNFEAVEEGKKICRQRRNRLLKA